MPERGFVHVQLAVEHQGRGALVGIGFTIYVQGAESMMQNRASKRHPHHPCLLACLPCRLRCVNPVASRYKLCFEPSCPTCSPIRQAKNTLPRLAALGRWRLLRVAASQRDCPSKPTNFPFLFPLVMATIVLGTQWGDEGKGTLFMKTLPYWQNTESLILKL